MWKRPEAIALLALLGAACAPAPPPATIPVVAADEDLAILVGDWWGSYSSVDTGRDGRIRFSLDADGDAAAGDVLMFPAESIAAGADSPPDAGSAGSRGGRTLTIRFVRLRPGDETVTGTLEPYLDPACDCLVTTTFTGRVSRDSIAGTYETRGAPGAPPSRGRWRVERRPAAD